VDGGELKEAIELWRDIYADGAKAKKLDVRASDSRKLARWLTARWSTVEALDALDEGKPSKQLQEDMDAQGVSAPGELSWLELSTAPSLCCAARNESGSVRSATALGFAADRTGDVPCTALHVLDAHRFGVQATGVRDLYRGCHRRGIACGITLGGIDRQTARHNL
jgi:hypothetical protein